MTLLGIREEVEAGPPVRELLEVCGDLLVFADPRADLPAGIQARWREMRDQTLKRIVEEI